MTRNYVEIFDRFDETVRFCLFFDFFEINRFNAHLNYMLFISGRKAVF
jgi:hypothetical protein